MKFFACEFCCPHSLKKVYTFKQAILVFLPALMAVVGMLLGWGLGLGVCNILKVWIFISLIYISKRLSAFFSSLVCQVGLRSLNLGICPKLNILSIEAAFMVSLELKGCGVLSEAFVNCPLLTSLDASFCRLCCICFFLRFLLVCPLMFIVWNYSRLTDDCLSATTASCPLIESLILMSCPLIGSDGLCSLSSLPNLTVLDLSYTFLVNLQPVFESCSQLKVWFVIECFVIFVCFRILGFLLL